MAEGDNPVLLSEETARRLIEGVTEYEKDPLLPRQRAGSTYRFPGQTNKLAVTTAVIAAISGGTPTSGPAILQLFNGSAVSAIAASYASVTIYNSTNHAIPSGSLVQLKRIDGFWFADSWSC
jgi:hypothetical protein